MTGTVPEIAVVDTHALAWWMKGEVRRLGRAARTFFERVDRGLGVACIPTTVLVEMSEWMRGGTIGLDEPFHVLVARLDNTPGRYQVVPLTASIVLRAYDLYAIPERGDRLIAATAAELGYPLVTRDREIVAAIGGDHVW